MAVIDGISATYTGTRVRQAGWNLASRFDLLRHGIGIPIEREWRAMMASERLVNLQLDASLNPSGSGCRMAREHQDAGRYAADGRCDCRQRAAQNRERDGTLSVNRAPLGSIGR